MKSCRGRKRKRSRMTEMARKQYRRDKKTMARRAVEKHPNRGKESV
jgi:hypothetical protein